MVKIGNIVNYGVGKFTLEHFNVFEEKSDIDFDNDLPTLLVGYDKTKAVYGELNFFDNRIENNLYWTCNRVEDRYNYNKDLGNFIDHCEEQLTKKFDYLFINPFELKLKQIKRFLNYLKSDKGYVVPDREMLYIWSHNKTFGFHTDLSDLFGVEKEHVLRFLVTNGYKILSEKEVQATQHQMGALDFDLAELLYLREKFAIA